MTLILLILIPLLSGLLTFGLKDGGAKTAALFSSLLTLAVAAYAAYQPAPAFSMRWMPALGASFSLAADGMGVMLCLLTGIVVFTVMLVQQNKDVENGHSFYALLLLSQAGLMGVFLASDALLFYFFWELALVPVYFLCSRWGGERRIPVTFKFFVYTFAGSLMLLAALIFIHLHTRNNSYAIADMIDAGARLPGNTQVKIFWLFFGAFAIKMPIFPFHTWQPDTYEQSPTPVTIILSALMVKMGIYAVVRWLLPTLPAGVEYWSQTVVILSIAGIVYASCIAMVQTDIKRLVAYSSIAHMGLMAAAAFSMKSDDLFHQGLNTSANGLLVQMFNHGINITGMWLLVSMIENRYGTRDMRRLGGMASAAPWMAIALVVIAFANIALPLTNGFIGEFLLFNGLFQSASPYHITFMVVAGLGVILGAVYTLNMVRSVAYGNTVEGIITRDLTVNEWIGLGIIISFIIVLGVYPAPLIHLVGSIVP